MGEFRPLILVREVIRCRQALLFAILAGNGEDGVVAANEWLRVESDRNLYFHSKLRPVLKKGGMAVSVEEIMQLGRVKGPSTMLIGEGDVGK